MIPSFVTIIVIEVSYVQKKFHSAQNVTDVSFFVVLPGAPNVGFWVPAKPLRFKHWGAREDFPLPNHALSLTAISKLSSTNSQHKRHKIYTGLGHRCGVIPYSSVVRWIASWADDEQYKGGTTS